ncbi:hypothetical protein PInf_006085 [Phytophthora infestans]|nr:hypothetical protein PInf_006085 [Phytophthora infestans]
MMAWSCGLLLLCVVGVTGRSPVDEELIAAEVDETQRAFATVEKQLGAAQQMSELFSLEHTQLQLLSLETRAKLSVIQEEVEKEMETAMREVSQVRQDALENVTTWQKTLQGLKEATQKNKQTLQKIREEKENHTRDIQRELKLQQAQEAKVKRQLEMLQELERQRALEKQLEQQEVKRLQELDQQELEKQRALQQLQKLEKETQQKLQKEQKMTTTSSSYLTQSDNTPSVEEGERASTVKRVLTWYVSTERAVMSAATSVYRQLVLPVAVILGFFLLLTVLIAKYNAVQHARRNRRVLYSGYPKSYRPKTKQQTEEDLRPRPMVHICNREQLIG